MINLCRGRQPKTLYVPISTYEVMHNFEVTPLPTAVFDRTTGYELQTAAIGGYELREPFKHLNFTEYHKIPKRYQLKTHQRPKTIHQCCHRH